LEAVFGLAKPAYVTPVPHMLHPSPTMMLQ